jgi:hypothetical protein
VITVYLGVAALLVWVGFEFVFRSRGEASSWHGDVRDHASTPVRLLAFAVAAILPAALRGWRLDQWGRPRGRG